MESPVRKPEGWIPKSPDGGWGWVVVLGSFLVHVFTDGIIYSFGIMVVEFLATFQEGRGLTSWIISILVGVTLGTGPIASAVANRFGCRAATIAGSVIASVGCAMCYFATSILYLAISVGVVVGIGFGLIYCPAIIIVTMYFEERRSFATGIAVCGAGVGTFIFAPFSSFLIRHYTWRGAFLIYSGLVLNCAVCGALFRPLEFVPVYEERKDAVEEDEDISRSEDDKLMNGFEGDTKSTSSDFKKRVLLREERSHTVSNVEHTAELRKVLISARQRAQGISESGGYMGIPDVFYLGSITSLPGSRQQQMYRSMSVLPRAAVGAIMERTDSEGRVRFVSAQPPAPPISDSPPIGASSKFLANAADCIGDVKKVLGQMISFSLLKDPLFIIFVISNFLTSIALNAPLIFLPDKATDVLNIPKEKASWLLSSYGLFNTLGRILIGFTSDKAWACRFGKNVHANRLWIYNISLTLCGFFTLFNYLCMDYTSLMIYAGTYICLTSVILVDLLGIDKLTNAFGLLLLFEGIASVLGPPIAGWLVDITGSFDYAFYFAGACLALSGIILYCIPCLLKRRNLLN